jgi:lipopolysaccharide export system protein LptA
MSGSGIITLDRTRRVLCLIPFALLLVVLLGSVRSDQPRSRTGRAMTDVKADRYIDRIVDGQRIQYLLGNVHIDRDSLTASSDSARYYPDRDHYEFLGNVVFTRHGAVLTCDLGNYNRPAAAGDFEGNVRLVDGEVIGTSLRGETRADGRYLRLMQDALLVTPDYSVRADTIFRDRQLGEGEAFGNVQIIEPEGKNLVTGDHAIFKTEGDIAEVDRNPVLISREQAGGPVVSTARLMRFFRVEDRVVMVDSVRIKQGATMARADTAIAYGRDRMVLRGAPQVSMNENSTMFGDEIEFRYRGGQLRRVILMGRARMEDQAPDSLASFYQGLPVMDTLEGDSISVEFENEVIERSVVVGNARSIYTPLDVEDEVATNDVTGDTIIIRFRNQQVNRVEVMGNMSGTYKFARVAAMRNMLDRGRNLADMMAAGQVDSSAVADSLLAAGLDTVMATLPTAMVDSMLTAALDSLAAVGLDTSAATMDFLASAEDVKYSGGRVDFALDDKAIDIREDGMVNYGTMKLTAQHIKMDTVDREVYAEGDPLVEDSDNIAGETLGYNFQHKTGAVADGVTSFDNYYYVGDEIRRFPDTTIKICGGRMTSCDLAEPHYHFWADKMKMRMKDKVVAAPIVLRIGNVPIFALPFYFKSLKEGRQSGILFPSFDFGWSSREGRYIRDFGYYWAASDYTDLLFEGDYNERRDFSFRVSNRYVKRYAFNGGIDYSRKISLGSSDRREWQLRWNHNQPTLWDDYKFRADARMASTTLSSNDLTSGTNQDVVSGQLPVNVYLSRNFGFMNANLSLSRTQFVNAEDADDPSSNNTLSTMTLPSLALSFKQITLAPMLRPGQKGSLLGDMARNTYFTQSYNLKSNRKDAELRDLVDYNASGSWGLSLRPPKVGIFNVSFSSNASHSWSRTDTTGVRFVAETDSTFRYEDVDNFVEDTNTRLSFSTGVGTTLYGIFPLQVGRLKALRHTLSMNSGWSVSPGLKSGQVHNTNINLSMTNRFDVKYLSAEGDTSLTEKKLDGILDWSLSTSYSPKREPGDRWSNISSGLTIKPGQSRALRLKVSNSIDPKNLALLSTRFTYGLNFSGRLDVGQVPAQPEARRNAAIDRLGVELEDAAADSLDDGFGSDEYGDQDFFDGEESAFQDFYDRPENGLGERDTKDATEGGRYIPFQMNASLSYNYSNTNRRKTTSANFSVNADLTRGWKFRYQGSFDLVKSSAVRQQFSLKRDLHCWALEFNRTVSTVDSQFGFRIYLKSIPALKFTRGVESGMGNLSGSLY